MHLRSLFVLYAMFIIEESVDLLLNILNEVVTMSLDDFNVNKTQDEGLTLKKFS